jgi:hypothetical protein
MSILRRIHDDLGSPPLPTRGEVVAIVLMVFVILAMTLVDVRP